MQGYVSLVNWLATFVHEDTCEESGFRVEDSDLWSIDSEGDTIGWDVRVDGNQGIWAGWDGEDAVAGEVSHGKAGVLDAEIWVGECEGCAGSEIIVLGIVRPTINEKAHGFPLLAGKEPKGIATNVGKV